MHQDKAAIAAGADIGAGRIGGGWAWAADGGPATNRGGA